MFVTCKLIVKVLKIRSNPVKFFWLVILSGSGQHDPNPVRFGQNFRSGRTLVYITEFLALIVIGREQQSGLHFKMYISYVPISDVEPHYVK